MIAKWITDQRPTRETCLNEKGLVWHQVEFVLNDKPYQSISPTFYSYVSDGEPWMPIAIPEPYLKNKRWRVYYCYNENKWCLQDVKAKHKTYLPSMTINDAESLAKMLRLADAYEEVLP